MTQLRWQSTILILGLALGACGPAAAPGRDGQTSNETRSNAPKHLTLGLSGEPGNIVSLMEGGGQGPGPVRDATHQHLVVIDDRGEARPQLATEVPSTTTGSWTVRPDGTMQTIYRLRSGVTWHDGAPLTARDFVFALAVHLDKDLPVGTATVGRNVGRIDTPDDLTLVIEWRAPYPFANAVWEEDLGPLPVHLLEAKYQSNKDQFPTLPYWKREFVGVGPYRLSEWEAGSHLTVKAYEQFHAGRAKIDTISFRFVADDATLIANFLAGAIDGIDQDSVGFREQLQVKEDLERAGQQPLMVGTPKKWRFLSVQFRPEVARPSELLDPRTRRGLWHAIDRPSMAEVMYAGQTPVADFFIPPTDGRAGWVKDLLVRVEYDPNRAAQLLNQVGWQRGRDGAMVNAAGERVQLSIWVSDDPDGMREQAIVADTWRALGLQVEQYIVPTAQRRDRQVRASYPSFDVTSVPVAFSNTTERLYSPGCPSEANRWTGNNRGCYQSPAMDRLVDSLHVAIDPSDQRRLYRDLASLYNEDVPLLQLYFKIDAALFRPGVTGPRLVSTDTRFGWNIADWDLK